MDALLGLRQAMENDTMLPLTTRLVCGEGSSTAPVVFIGEAPGAKEDELGRPFVGRGGQMLRQQIERIGWHCEEVYITNIVKRRPPDNRDPLPSEVAAYRPYLVQELSLIKPKLIVTVGRFSLHHFVPNVKITEVQGTLLRMEDYVLYPIVHPAAAMRSKRMMTLFVDAFTRLPEVYDDVISPLEAA
jgi:uracil-DNA glycosylase